MGKMKELFHRGPTPGPWTFGSDLQNNHAIETKTSNAFNDELIGILTGANEANARLISVAPELLLELEMANQIIINALNIMTGAQKRKWDLKNFESGCKADLGTTRNYERETAIAKARGVKR